MQAKCKCGCGGEVNLSGKTDKKRGKTKGQPNNFICGHRPKKPKEEHPNWTGGRNIQSNGYVRIWMPEHPNSQKQGYVLEHLLVAEKILGKPLPTKAVIHHVYGNRKNNSPNNLVICEDNNYHRLLHQRENALKHGGNKDMRKCIHCKKYDYPNNLTMCGNTIYHKSCEKTHGYDRRRAVGKPIRKTKEA